MSKRAFNAINVSPVNSSVTHKQIMSRVGYISVALDARLSYVYSSYETNINSNTKPTKFLRAKYQGH